MFKVYDASKYEIQSGIDKVILKSITELVSRMKNNAQFSIKEDVTSKLLIAELINIE